MSTNPQFLNDLHRQRTTLPLKGTHSKQQAALDFRSVLSIQYAQAWLNRQEESVPYPSVHPKAPLGGVMRRALAVYMDHLNKPGTDLNTEAFLMRLACATSGTATDDQPACLERLAASMSDPTPVPFAEVFHGQEMAEAFERMNALEA